MAQVLLLSAQGDRAAAFRAIGSRGHDITAVTGDTDARAALAATAVDLLVVDHRYLGEFAQLVSDLPSLSPGTVAVVIGGGSIEAAAAIDAGADDWLPDTASSVFPVRMAVIERRLARRPSAGRLGMNDLLEQSADLLYTLDADGRFLWVSPSAGIVTGWTPEQLIGRDATEVTAPESLENLALRAELRRAGIPTPSTYEFAVVRPDGTRAWLETRSRGIVRAGRLEGVVGVARDVTDRHALESRVALHAQLLDQVDAAVMALTPAGEISYWNEHASQVFGWPLDEIIGRPLDILVAPGDLGTARALGARVLAGATWEGEFFVVRKDHSRFLAHVVATPILSANGHVETAAVVVFDLTERQRAETALRVQEQGFRMLFAANPQPMWVYDLVTDEFLEVNEAAVRGYGYSRDEFLAMHVGDVRAEGETERLNAYIAAGNRDNHDAGEWRHRRKDGSPLVARIRTHAIDFRGHAARLVVAEDVTASKTAEQARALLAAIVESSDAAIIARDLQGRISAWNRGAQELYGYTAEEVIGNSSTLLDPELREDDPTGVRALELAALAGETRHLETVRRRNDGQEVEIAVSVFPVVGAGGTVLGTAGIARDITERKRAEREQATLAAIVSSGADAIILRGLDGRVIGWNPGAERLYGYTAAEAMGTTVALIALPGLEEDDAARFARVTKGEVVHVESRRRRKDGTFVDVAFQGYPVRLPNGTVIGFAGISRDISDRKRQEQALRESEANYRTVVEGTSDALYVMDLAADGEWYCTRINRAYVDLLGRTPESVLNRSLEDGVGAIQAEAILPRYRRAVETRQPVQWEARANIGGVEKTLSVQVAPVTGEDGECRRLIGSMRDVTALRTAETALREAQKLESLGILAGGIAHDFNNLLVGILGNAGLALAELPANSPARETIRDIETAGQRAADLARQMLAYSGKGRFVIQTIDLTDLVEEMTQLLRSSITRGARLEYGFARDLPAVEADATQLRQVVMNLVVNASDAIGNGEGVIGVRTGTMHATPDYLAESYLSPTLPGGPYVYLDVTDSGSGMDAATLAKIFDPFFSTKFTGRGLGLAAVLGIVRGHQGAIRVDSEPGRGTTIRLLLPAAAVPVTITARPLPPAGAWQGHGTVLVVDDEASVRAVTARALKMFGFEVIEAGDGQEGLELFSRDPAAIAAVLLDLTMPRLSGEDTFREIRAVRPDATVILMSGYSEQEAMSHFAADGLAGFVQKPYGISTLRDVMQGVLSD